jgi:HAD superfamily hydrolase (TIGR01509 family)
MNKTILVDAYQGIYRPDLNGVDQQMYLILEGFDNSKVIVTNATSEKMVELGMIDLPYPVFTQNFNPLKTDPKYYLNLLSEYNLTPDQVIYFEHDNQAVESARSIGINSYCYDYEKRDLTALESFLRENI